MQTLQEGVIVTVILLVMYITRARVVLQIDPSCYIAICAEAVCAALQNNNTDEADAARCGSATEYARQCYAKNIIFDWRSAVLCRKSLVMIIAVMVVVVKLYLISVQLVN